MDLVEMSKGELERYTVIRKLEACLINQQQAAMALNLSVRQVRRIWKHYQSFGAAGLISRQRGRPSNRAIAADHKTRYGKPLSLYSDRHGIFTKHDPEDPDPTQYGRATLQLGVQPADMADVDEKTINSRVNSLVSKSKSTQRQKMLAQFEHQDYQRQQGIYKPTHHTSQI